MRSKDGEFVNGVAEISQTAVVAVRGSIFFSFFLHGRRPGEGCSQPVERVCEA